MDEKFRLIPIHSNEEWKGTCSHCRKVTNTGNDALIIAYDVRLVGILKEDICPRCGLPTDYPWLFDSKEEASEITRFMAPLLDNWLIKRQRIIERNDIRPDILVAIEQQLRMTLLSAERNVP